MAETLAVSLYAHIQVTQVLTDDLQNATFTTSPRPAIALSYGTGTGQADTTFSDSWTVGSSSTRIIDLQNFSVMPLNNRALSFAKVKIILFSNTSATVQTLFNNGSTPFNGPMTGTTPTITLNQNEFFLAWNPVNGWSSANGVNDKFLVSNATASVGTFDYYIIGTSA